MLVSSNLVQFGSLSVLVYHVFLPGMLGLGLASRPENGGLGLCLGLDNVGLGLGSRGLSFFPSAFPFPFPAALAIAFPF